MKVWFLVVFLLAIVSCKKDAPLGSEERPITIYFSPSQKEDRIKNLSTDLVNFLFKKTGNFYKVFVPSNNKELLNIISTNKADVVFPNTFTYITANEKYQLKANFRLLRGGKGTYRGQILAHKNSEIKSIKDIDGKRFAFTDSKSLTGYLVPLKILLDQQVSPSKTIFAGKHTAVVKMIYNQAVDAGATFYAPPNETGEIMDARKFIKEEHPDVEDQVVPIQLTKELPNEPLCIRFDLPERLKKSFNEAIKAYFETEKGKELFMGAFGADGLEPTADDQYEDLKEMIKKINLDLSKYL